MVLHPRLRRFETQLSPSPLERIHDPEFAQHGVELWIKRDDLLHPIVSGNKWRKLKYILDHVLRGGFDSVVTMGGAHSNHLHALAYAGKELGLNTIAFVRGERPAKGNPTLDDLEKWGMALCFVSRGDYRTLRDYRNHDSLPGLHSGQYWLPEGGAVEQALRGVGEIVGEIDMAFDQLIVACGTGTSLAGLIATEAHHAQFVGIAALKGGLFLEDDVKRLLSGHDFVHRNWRIVMDLHHGGFAKTTPELLACMAHFQARYSIALDPVYTGKMVYAAYGLLRQGAFKPGQRVVLLHTGGLQGTRKSLLPGNC